MTTKTDTTVSNYWEDVPDELRAMILADCRGCSGCGEYHSSKPIIDFLTAHMKDCDTTIQFQHGATPYNVLRWIDIGMESLFPVEFHSIDWVDYREEIETILKREETLLQKYAPADYGTGYRRPEDRRLKTDIVGIAQRLNVYFCALYSASEKMTPEDMKAFQEKLKRVFSDTSNNVYHLLVHKDAYELATENDWAEEFHYPGTDDWETLEWIAKEAVSDDAMIEIAKCYEDYATLLYTWTNIMTSSEACIHLHNKAERILVKLCRSIVERNEEMMDNNDEDGIADREMLQMKTALWEKTIQESVERQTRVGPLEKQNDSFVVTDGKKEKSNSYHEKYGPFTEKLRRLMAQSQCSNMPVVLLHCNADDNDIDCGVVDVFDHDGEFRERIIGIWNMHDRETSEFDTAFIELDDDGGELPF